MGLCTIRILCRINLQRDMRGQHAGKEVSAMFRSILYFILPWIAFVCMAFEKSKISGISFVEAITSPFLVFLFVAASFMAAIEVYREHFLHFHSTKNHGFRLSWNRRNN